MGALDERQSFHGMTDTLPQVERLGVAVAGAVTLKPWQQTVVATANTATGSYTITLPSVVEAAGKIYSIHADIANATAVTLQDNADDGAFTNAVLDTDNDRVLLYSDGRRWWTLGSAIA